MEITPLSDALGCEAEDLDITRPLTDDEIRRLRAAYESTHAVLVRGQELTRDQMARFCTYFWPPQKKPDGTPLWSAVSNTGDDAVVRRTGIGVLLFHSDQAYAEQPGVGQVLYADHVTPPVAPTTFANNVRAASRLPVELRDRLAHLEAVHLIDFECTDEDVTYRVRESDLPVDASPSRYPRTTHPVFYPVNGRGDVGLFVTEQMTSHLVGLDEGESEELLQACFKVLYASDNVYRHEWQPHDIIVWNNLALQHGRPLPASSGIREFWRLKSFVPPGADDGLALSADAPDAFDAWARGDGARESAPARHG